MRWRREKGGFRVFDKGPPYLKLGNKNSIKNKIMSTQEFWL
jgi:hypothetical protein